MSARTAAALLLGFSLSLACSGDNLFGPRPIGGGRLELGDVPDLEADARELFLDVAFGSEFGTSADSIRKWTRSPRVRIIGGTEADRTEIRQLLNTLAALTSLAPVIDTTASAENNDIRVFFTPRDNFAQLVVAPAGTRGATTASWNDAFELQSAVVVIDSAAVGDERTHLITEELTQAFGLLSDSFRREDSILFAGPSQRTTLSPLDRRVVELLYLPQIRPGMSATQVDSVFDALDS